MSASHLTGKWDCEVACLQQRDGVQQHFHPWLVSRLRMLQNKPHVQVLSQRSAIHAYSPWIDAKLIPAPMTTLDSPRHNDMYPSIREIVAIALPMPVYMAAGVGLTTCIRVYDACQQSRTFLVSATSNAYLSRSMGYMTECSCANISLLSLHLLKACVVLRRCQQRHLRPYWPPARSLVGVLHSCVARISSNCARISRSNDRNILVLLLLSLRYCSIVVLRCHLLPWRGQN